MIDRQIFRTTPASATRGVSPEFVESSSLDSVRNVVLLGDPGAGNTHLLKIAAQACNGRYMTVRTFLNSPANWSDRTRFLDALDERRSGRRDDSVVDDPSPNSVPVSAGNLRLFGVGRIGPVSALAYVD